jgi:class 3 adenylate cyclase
MTSITRKVTILLLSSLVIGIGAVVFYFAYGQNKTLYTATLMSLRQQADVLHQSVKNAMLPGEAPLAVSLFTDIQRIGPMYDIRLYRRNGVLAFSDDSTIAVVNEKIGMQQFETGLLRLQGPAIEPEDQHFSTVVNDKKTVAFQHKAGSKTYLTTYKPLQNLPKCTSCHGGDHTLRGVIAIQVNMTDTIEQARNNIFIAVAIFIGIVLLLFIVLTVFLRRGIINPVKRISQVCTAVTGGNFHEKVQVNSRDEIGELGETINTMVDGLYERYELSKFVSSSTIMAISDRSEKGVKTEITLFFSDIRGFTSFSEKLQPETVVQHLNDILTIQTDIIQQHGGDIDKYVGDEIVALFFGENKEQNACRCALEIQRYLARQQERLSGLSVGIGINTGEVILGMIGSEKRADYTVIGDHVNFASRLCSKAKRGAIIISDNTYQRVQPLVRTAGPYEIRVKGKEHAHQVYALVGLKGGT